MENLFQPLLLKALKRLAGPKRASAQRGALDKGGGGARQTKRGAGARGSGEAKRNKRRHKRQTRVQLKWSRRGNRSSETARRRSETRGGPRSPDHKQVRLQIKRSDRKIRPDRKISAQIARSGARSRGRIARSHDGFRIGNKSDLML